MLKYPMTIPTTLIYKVMRNDMLEWLCPWNSCSSRCSSPPHLSFLTLSAPSAAPHRLLSPSFSSSRLHEVAPTLLRSGRRAGQQLSARVEAMLHNTLSRAAACMYRRSLQSVLLWFKCTFNCFHDRHAHNFVLMW